MTTRVGIAFLEGEPRCDDPNCACHDLGLRDEGVAVLVPDRGSRQRAVGYAATPLGVLHSRAFIRRNPCEYADGEFRCESYFHDDDRDARFPSLCPAHAETAEWIEAMDRRERDYDDVMTRMNGVR